MHDLGGLQNPQSCHWSDEFQKNQHFFRKTVLPEFGAPGCHPSTLIDFANTVLVSKRSVGPICIISEGYITHGGDTGPMKFKKKRTFFFRKIVLPGFWGSCLPSKHLN